MSNLAENVDFDLSKISISTLEIIKTYILKSPEYMKLFRCTQMRDQVLREDESKSTNRGTHTINVAITARNLASTLLREAKSELTEDEEKEILIAEIVGLAHDLGHTPMGHDGEEAIKESTGFKFKHAEYGGVIFAQIFNRMINQVNTFNKPIISDKKRKEIEDSQIRDYIINGVQNHSAYLSNQAKGKSAIDLALVCGRLADTLSFMLTDLQDLSQAERAAGLEGTILTEEIILKLIENGEATRIGDIDSKEELPTENIIGKGRTLSQFFSQTSNNVDYRDIVARIISGDPSQLEEIRARIVQEVAIANQSRLRCQDDPIISVPDELKILRGKESEARSHGQKISEDMQQLLAQKTDEFRQSCPTLALIYELHDEFVYNQIIYRDTTVLGNDETNKEILGEMLGKFRQEYTELSPEEKGEFDEIYSLFESYMPLGGEEMALDELKAKAYAIYKLQSLTNDDIDRERENCDFVEAMQSLLGDKAKESFDTLTSKQQETLKRRILEAQGKIKEVTAKAPVYKSQQDANLEISEQGNMEDESKLRVAMFGKENWKAVIGDRTIDDLQNIISIIRGQEKDRTIDKDSTVMTTGENR